MAALEGKSPMIFETVGDTVGNNGHNYKVTCIRFVASGSGQFIFLDKLGGREIAKSATLSAGETDEINFDSHWFDGLYLSATAGKAYVYYA